MVPPDHRYDPFWDEISQSVRYKRRTYDITPGRDDTLPDKWHGILLGNEQGVTSAWERTAAQAGATADSLHACPIPHGSRGRVNLAQHMMSKAFATLRLTAPTDQRRVQATLGQYRSTLMD